MSSGDNRIRNAMTIDVEDYFQVQAFADRIDRSDWDSLECRVEANTDLILEMLSEHSSLGTFFTLGWIAQRYPSLVRRIVDGGHELASHGMAHHRADRQTPAEFRADIRSSKRLLEDIGGAPVKGYRAASFSIGDRNAWAFEVLGEEGYAYSSSIYPIRHDLYGSPDAPRFRYRPRSGTRIWELPVSTVRLFGRNLPCGGGGYFRLLPYAVSRWQIAHVNRSDRQACIFYIHPWEFDDAQPRQANLPLRTRVRHYTNLSRVRQRYGALLEDFAWGRLDGLISDMVA
jgi:polysaccharide deacetylase family protein (PEP-CTERM system associated)